MDSDTVIIEVIDSAPQLSDIPDTSFAVNDTLVFSLDLLVHDCDDPVDQLQWTIHGNANILIDIDPDRMAFVSSPLGWTGTELVTFEVSDPDLNIASDSALLTVIPGSAVSGDHIGGPMQGDFVLWQNCPNPFNAETVVRYQIPDGELPMLTTLKLYNALGQEVVVLVDGLQAPGYHEVAWDGKDSNGREMTSGIYVGQLKAGRFVGMIRLILLK